MTVRAEIRGDLVKRLFAVAISVGAASTIAKMNWVSKSEVPHVDECKQLFVLVVAITATVLSWDGYLVAISTRPLDGFWRFAIDILLVFIYMILLMTSVNLTWWLPIHAITFVLYTIWDLLTVREHTSVYYKDVVLTPPSAMEVYKGGLFDSDKVSRGPIVTLCFTIYFVGLYLVSRKSLSSHIFFTSAFAFVGLVLYRQDKIWQFRNIHRIGLILFMLIGAAAFAKLRPWDDWFISLALRWL